MTTIKLIPKGGTTPEVINPLNFYRALAISYGIVNDDIIRIDDKQFILSSLDIADSAGASVTVANTVFVSKNGNDSTGLVERMDKPFLTIAAARNALVAYYTGANAPSATNRILIKVFSGYYNEPIILDNFVDLDLSSSVVTCTSSQLIKDNGVAVDSIIYGSAKLYGVTMGGGNAIQATANSNIRIYCDTVIGRTVSTNGIVTINARKVDGDGDFVVQGLGGTVIINAYELTSSGAIKTIKQDSGTTIINASIISSPSDVPVSITGGSLTINAARIVTAGVNKNAVEKTGGTLILNNATMIATGTGKSIFAPAPQSVKIYGACQGNLAVDANITQQVGIVKIDANVI